ncbi:rRNA biogenesis protein rrp36 [Sorochytrium milnesiophthora]
MPPLTYRDDDGDSGSGSGSGSDSGSSADPHLDSSFSDSDTSDDELDLSNVPLGELAAARRKIATDKKEAEQQQQQRHNGQPKSRRADKNMPMEMSSKKAVSRKRQVVDVPTIARRDPRFDSLSGKFNADLFSKTYAFVEDHRNVELGELRAALAREKNPEEAERLQKTLQRLQSQQRARTNEQRQQQVKREWKKKELQAVKDGKKPFFLKKAEEKRLYMISKFKDASSGDLDKLLEKRRKRNAAKEKRYLPYERRRNTGEA